MKTLATVIIALSSIQIPFVSVAEAGSSDQALIKIRHINTDFVDSGLCAYSLLLTYTGKAKGNRNLAGRQIRLLFVAKGVKAGYGTINLKGEALSDLSLQRIETVMAPCSADRIVIDKYLISSNGNPIKDLGIIINVDKFNELPISISN